MKKIIVYIVILIILGCNHQPTLIELQRLGVTAVSMSEKRKIVNLVEKHYLSINRQDSILSHINEIVETTISEYDVNIRLEKMELLGNENIYETELKTSWHN